MNTKIIQILRESVANTWKKKGCACYRSLLVDDSKESEEAIQYMEELGLAYNLQYEGNGNQAPAVKLPALFLSFSKVYQGLAEIKRYGYSAIENAEAEVAESSPSNTPSSP